ncbi:MAG: MFS transporter [Rhodospirillales bacterium]|nr:MFS transporter [Rhodospirillales bacterium]MDH3913372.1 MFS transporter [Rhodospirillales bacterium]MDH3968104.1 MFS transporter [Rhodospirillales bacterium]
MKQASAFKAILDVRRSELPLALLMFGYFFLVITSFWILKPIKKSLFIEHYEQSGFNLLGWQMSGPQAELIAKVLNMVVAFAAVIVFTWLARRFRRQQLSFVFTAFFLVSYAAYSFVLGAPGSGTVWSFYLFGDLFSTLMVATFFAFLNDSVTPDAAKRLYGLVGLGGVSGGVFGSYVVAALIAQVDRPQWLWICFAIGLMIAAVAFLAGRIVDRNPPPESAPQEPPREEKAPSARNPAVEGAVLVFRSPYLLSIVAIVGLYEIVSTILDFQFTSTIAHYLEGEAIGRQFSIVFAITNTLALLVQLLLTGFVMSRLGVGVALLVLPVAILAASAGYAALPILWMGSLLNTADNGFSYSINQSAKESLYVPTTKDEKYKAKAFIDMFVQRFAKAIAVVVSLGITTVFVEFASIRWLSAVIIPLIVLWIFAAVYAGRRFREVTE